MKKAYPVVLSPDAPGYSVYVPDFDINAQGEDLAEALFMARDAIGIIGIDMEDEKKSLPSPTPIKQVLISDNDVVSLVDVDFAEYRRRHELRVVKKNCTLPAWLCHEAENAKINFSATLQNALKKELRISD